MTLSTPRPAGRVVTIRATWDCSCGRERKLLVANVNTDLPLNLTGRKTGACPDCGRVQAYSVETRTDHYLVKVG